MSTTAPGSRPDTNAPTVVAVDLVNGRPRLSMRNGTYLSPRPLPPKGNLARITLMSIYAMLLGGDDVHIDIRVGSGVGLEIVEPSGVVAYDAHGRNQQWTVTATVADAGFLVWRSAAFVVTAGADVIRRTTLDIAAGGCALMSETIALGRSYEDAAGPFRSINRVSHDGRPLLVEDIDLRDRHLTQSVGILGDNRVMSTVMLLGKAPQEMVAACESPLHGPGALARAVAGHAHEAEQLVDGSWHRWRTEFATPRRAAPPQRSASPESARPATRASEDETPVLT
ncbi:urease accessory protein [Stackebrandtia endophytica]|uniref:Urease accessory protein UreD n=1 Tax=Stackebrandtia endophytica TaxID=1496996 RepID=A0A543AVM5_9ACTN|nr:urease accessory protein UreD [Stackebrandtia endophytica]TQL76639.1 urease accessory protein [Stackebrandtia endophytica]